MNLSKLTKEQLLNMLQQQQQAQASGLLVKRNKSGGVFIRADHFIEWSEAKGKEYTYGMNLPYATAKKLFNDEGLLELIKGAINDMNEDDNTPANLIG